MGPTGGKLLAPATSRISRTMWEATRVAIESAFRRRTHEYSSCDGSSKATRDARHEKNLTIVQLKTKMTVETVCGLWI